jgi:hypothetical protein
MMRPPYIDPDTNIIYDIDNPEYEGWLTKQSMWLKVWMDGWMFPCWDFFHFASSSDLGLYIFIF